MTTAAKIVSAYLASPVYGALAPSTQRTRSRWLERWLATLPPGAPAHQTRADLRAFVLTASPPCQVHVKGALVAAYDWALDCEVVVGNPALRLKTPRVEKPSLPPRFIPFEAFLQWRDRSKSIFVPAFSLMIAAGLRASSVAPGAPLELFGRGDGHFLRYDNIKMRRRGCVIALSAQGVSAAAQWIETRGGAKGEFAHSLNSALRYGTPLIAVDGDGRTHHASSHCARSTFATVAWRALRGDVFELQKLLNHEGDIRVTGGYVRDVPDALTDAWLLSGWMPELRKRQRTNDFT